VIAPLSGMPAEEEGVKAGDLILKIDDRETIDITLPEAVNLIRGPKGTTVRLTLLHKGETEPYEAS
ncbi:PDZ domain-containing protein, partial [Candidatus Saccharibacteria bacterium]|nr:PDZ domain-containing protein [Candidatus Saccharibacteria bacterium]